MRDRKKIKSKIKWYLIGFLSLLIILPVIWLLILRLEGGAPSIEIEPQPLFIGMSQTFEIKVSDEETGVRKVWVGLLKEGKESVLIEKRLPSKDILSGGAVSKKSFPIVIEPGKMGIKDGKAMLRMVVRDYSWRNRFSGNKTYKELEIVVDTKPPAVDILTKQHNMSQGGSGLAIYRISEKNTRSGVVVGENFFPGHSGHFENEYILMAFFALDHKQSKGTEIYVKAIDQAGNSTRAGFFHYIQKRKFKKDSIQISDRFLNWKMPEFDVESDYSPNSSKVEKFLKVNREIRKANITQLTALAENTDNVLYWEEAFQRLPKSATKAGFADHRIYTYNGRVIDEQNHMGIDLASVAHSPIPAANKGKIIFAGPIGIFGKTVVIDHGFGILSMYSHLSRINIQNGQVVNKKEIIGHTGNTGLAGGDHLHFGMFIHKTFVNPLEWWDGTWIKNNITTKINEVKDM